MQQNLFLHAQRLLKLVLCTLLSGVLIQFALATQAPPLAENPELEVRVLQVAAELRCLVCQNESIADSHADLATDLRNQIREQLKSGKTQQEIITYMVDRYGDFVLYKPPVKSNTLVLWFGPFVLLIFSLWTLARYVRKEKSPEPSSLSKSEEIMKARELLSSSRKDLK